MNPSWNRELKLLYNTELGQTVYMKTDSCMQKGIVAPGLTRLRKKGLLEASKSTIHIDGNLSPSGRVDMTCCVERQHDMQQT